MLNQCQFIGNVGRDPEIRHTQDNKKIVNFSLAVSEKWKSASGEQKERTEWVRVVCFNDGLSGVIENYVKKGSKLFISGKMQTRKWQDQSGSDKYSTEVVLQGFDCKLVMLDGKDAGGQQAGGGGGDFSGKPGNEQAGEYLEDQIPFVSPYPVRGLV